VPTTVSNPRDLLLALLGDLLFVERRLAGNVLPEVVRAVADAELRTALEAHLEETRTHVERVEKAFRRLDAAPSANLSRAFEGLVAQHDEVASSIVEERLRDVFHAAAALHVEHYELAGYRAAIVFAERAGRDDVAEPLAETVAEEKRAAAAATEALERLSSAR
jgi:ferritin-like metal-binding protein YciE